MTKLLNHFKNIVIGISDEIHASRTYKAGKVNNWIPMTDDWVNGKAPKPTK